VALARFFSFCPGDVFDVTGTNTWYEIRFFFLGNRSSGEDFASRALEFNDVFYVASPATCRRPKRLRHAQNAAMRSLHGVAIKTLLTAIVYDVEYSTCRDSVAACAKEIAVGMGGSAGRPAGSAAGSWLAGPEPFLCVGPHRLRSAPLRS
jgi:hypothetical protein